MKKMVLLNKKGYYLVKLNGMKIRISEGEISVEELEKKKPGDKIKTHKGEEFTVIEPNLIDLMKKMKRSPQIMTPKDVSLILAYTGISANSLIVDAGSGSGFNSI